MYPATAAVEHVHVNRTLILAGSGILVCASYLAVIFGIAPERRSGHSSLRALRCRVW